MLIPDMQIDGDTRLSQVLDSVPDSLDYIVGLNPHDFERLRNPVLRRDMASRISLRRVVGIASTPEETLVGQVRVLVGGNGAVGGDPFPAISLAVRQLEWYAEPSADRWQIFVYRPADVAAPPGEGDRDVRGGRAAGGHRDDRRGGARPAGTTF